MENFNKIFIPKIDKEEENLESEDKNKENKTEKESSVVVIEVDGVKMEGEKNYFEYPESVQKETGILGYDRTIVSNENLNNFIKDYCQNVYNFDIEKYGFDGLDSFLKIEHELSEITSKKLNEIKGNYSISVEERDVAEKDYRESEEFKNLRHLSDMYSNLNKKILYNMSDGNYPNKTFNHIISRYSNHKKSDLDNFVKNKFFIQKIYDSDLIKKLSDDGTSNIFNSNGNFGEAGGSRITVYDKQTGRIAESGNDITFDKLAKSKYINDLKNGNCFAYTKQSGLNFSVGRFFQNFGTGRGGTLPSFGFNMEDNNFLSKYLDKVLKNNLTEASLKDKIDIEEVLIDILFLNKNILKILLENSKDGYKEMKSRCDFDKADKLLLKIEIESCIKKIENENKIDLNDYTKMEIDIIINRICWRAEQGEIRMPIYIGHDDIPQLCWGHASYGHFINSSGLNFFEFKHDSSILEKDA